MKRIICDFCGKEFVGVFTFGPEYGLVRLKNDGRLYLSFDACEECLENIIKEIDSHTIKAK